MTPLIDGDILKYEIGYAAEAGWQHEGTPSWDYTESLLTLLIENIKARVGATAPPEIYFTGKTNFRNKIAVTHPYKLRPSKKPFHYYNIQAYLEAVYSCFKQEGLEADDLMAIRQLKGNNDTIICSRDKDLRIVPGWQYGWELGNQPEFGPELVDEVGRIRLSNDRRSIKGSGLLFFYAQCLMGDPTDTIPGLGGCGPVKAFKILDGCIGIDDAFKRVLEAYRGLYGPSGDARLLEQGRLLWMTRELHEDGSPVLWEFPKIYENITSSSTDNPTSVSVDSDNLCNGNSNTICI